MISIYHPKMEYLPIEVSVVSKIDLECFSHRKRVGSYLLGETIGEGSFAKVKIAMHVSTGEKVAIKIINKKKAREDRYVSRNLKREAEIMQMSRHNNIVRLLEVMETDNFYYLVTELCSGGELLDLICEKKYFDEDTTRLYIQQLVSAVSSMHRAGIVHRDLKIENFLLDNDDNLKIIDFGLSNVLPTAALETWDRTGMCPLLLTTHCGSPAYAAPELLAQEAYGAQIDVWSIGVNMFAMLTGNLPFTMEPFSIIDLYHKMMERKMTPFPKRISSGARDLILQFLDPIPQKRITLQQAANHPWLVSSAKPSASCEKTAGNREINQDIILHIAENMGMNIKEIVTSVTKNRASHSFAIYFLLKERLRKFEERKKAPLNAQIPDPSFTKVKVIKKAKLSTDKISSARNRFKYKGVKIKTDSTSHPRLHDEIAQLSGLEKRYLESPEYQQVGEQWNQYATFPRDRRTTNSKESKDIGAIGNASLDRGSDDIDYQRVSSPETTDNSASSLDSQQAQQCELLHIKDDGASTQLLPREKHASSTGESGSEDEYCGRSRSKSLTNSEEYDNSRNLFSTIARTRTSSMANCFHHNCIETSPRKGQYQSENLRLRAMSPTNRRRSTSPGMPRNHEYYTREHALNEIQDVPDQESNTHISEQNHRKTASGIKTRGHNNKENIDDLREKNMIHGEQIVPSVLKLKKASISDGSAFVSPRRINGVKVSRKPIPPPAPFKDESATISIKKLESKECLNYRKEKRAISKVERKEIVDKPEGKSKTSSRKKNQRRHHEKSKSLSDIKMGVTKQRDLHKIEVEKVRRIELEPLKNPTMQIAPTLHTMSPFSLNCVKQESPCHLESLSHQLKVTTEPENDHEQTLHGPYKAIESKTFQVDSLKQTPFKVGLVKLAKWQCVPVFRAEYIAAKSVKKLSAGPALPLAFKTEGKGEPKDISAEKLFGKSRNTCDMDSKTRQQNVHRTRSCSAVDFTAKFEKDGEVCRKTQRRPRVQSRTSTGRITVRKSSAARSGNVFTVDKPSPGK